jgi:hypothetical protein
MPAHLGVTQIVPTKIIYPNRYQSPYYEKILSYFIFQTHNPNATLKILVWENIFAASVILFFLSEQSILQNILFPYFYSE